MFHIHLIYRLFHCAPNVPHYAKNKAVGVMKPGHCFTIEPMISEGVGVFFQIPQNINTLMISEGVGAFKYLKIPMSNQLLTGVG